MTPLSESTLEAIRTNDFETIQARLCDPERGVEQQFLYKSYKKLVALFTHDEGILLEESESLYDFQSPNIQPSRNLLDFLAYAAEMNVLTISDVNDPDDLLSISFLLQALEILGFSGCGEVHLDRFLESFPKLTEIRIENGLLRVTDGNSLPALPLESITFDRNGLSSLPQGLENMRHLTHFTCTGNKLTEFPAFIPSIHALRNLDLSGNQIAGGLPASMGQNVNLALLNLKNNQLDDVQSLEQLPKLTSLNLQGNPIQSFPTELPTLESLTVDADQFSNMHDLLPRCPQLKTLNILGGTSTFDFAAIQQNVQLSNIFIVGVEIQNLDLITTLTALETLRLGNNRLQGDLSPIFTLSKMKSLTLNGNGLTELPDKFDQLPALRELDITQNALKTLPPSLLASRVMKSVSVWGNLFTKEYLTLVHEQTCFRIR